MAKNIVALCGCIGNLINAITQVVEMSIHAKLKKVVN
jgi:hypothetical protein